MKPSQKELIVERYDPDELIDVLGISTEELIDYIAPFIENNLHKLEDLVHDRLEEVYDIQEESRNPNET